MFPLWTQVQLQKASSPPLMPDCHVYFCLQFSQMIKLYHSLGPEKFPLNEQTFYPNHMQMVSALPSFKQY